MGGRARGLQVAAQNVIDIATHLAASAGQSVPDYTSAIDALGTLGIVPNLLVQQLRPMAGFRNVLVHAYLAVDRTRLHRLLNERLDDFVRFAEAVKANVG